MAGDRRGPSPSNDPLLERWRSALELGLEEPVLCVCSFAVGLAAGANFRLPDQVVIAITPICVRVYERSPAGDTEAPRELVAWSRTGLVVSVARDASGIALELRPVESGRVQLRGARRPETDAFIRLVTHEVVA